MAWDFDVMGWSDIYGNRHEGQVPEGAYWGAGDEGPVDGVLVRSHDPKDRDSVEYHWVYMTEPWEDWDDLLSDVDDALAMYGEA